MPTGILNNLFGRLSSNDASAVRHSYLSLIKYIIHIKNVGLPKPDPKSIERLATRQELLGRKFINHYLFFYIYMFKDDFQVFSRFYVTFGSL